MSFEKPIGAIADVREIEYISALHQVGDDGIRVDGSIRGTFVKRIAVHVFCCVNLFSPSHSLCGCLTKFTLLLFHKTHTDADIAAFLCSRYGIIVTAEEVRKVILNGLGGVVTTPPPPKEDVGGEDTTKTKKDDAVVPGPYSSIDLMKVVALLFIPTILKAANAEVGSSAITSKKKKKKLEDDDDDDEIQDASVVMVPPPPNLIQSVLNMILKDVSYVAFFSFEKF